MSEFVLTSAEKVLFEAFDGLGVRYLIVGMGAALLEGANGTTQDIDVWLESMDSSRVNRVDQVRPLATVEGLASFDTEYADAAAYELDGVRVRVLPLERVIASKRASNRPKDKAQLPILETTLAARRRRQ